MRGGEPARLGRGRNRRWRVPTGGRGRGAVSGIRLGWTRCVVAGRRCGVRRGVVGDRRKSGVLAVFRRGRWRRCRRWLRSRCGLRGRRCELQPRRWCRRVGAVRRRVLVRHRGILWSCGRADGASGDPCASTITGGMRGSACTVIDSGSVDESVPKGVRGFRTRSTVRLTPGFEISDSVCGGVDRIVAGSGT